MNSNSNSRKLKIAYIERGDVKVKERVVDGEGKGGGCQRRNWVVGGKRNMVFHGNNKMTDESDDMRLIMDWNQKAKRAAAADKLNYTGMLLTCPAQVKWCAYFNELPPIYVIAAILDPSVKLQARIAKDIFAICASTIASESAFSAGGRVLDEKRSRLSSEIIDMYVFMMKQREEERLFQFLLGVDENYHAQRSQLLMQTPLPTVQATCARLQQEETQRDVLCLLKLNLESSSMISKGKTEEKGDLVCDACGKRRHKAERCWTVVGYPK
ncbi:putative AC transposase [Bienertia sinuspersici]